MLLTVVTLSMSLMTLLMAFCLFQFLRVSALKTRESEEKFRNGFLEMSREIENINILIAEYQNSGEPESLDLLESRISLLLFRLEQIRNNYHQKYKQSRPDYLKKRGHRK